MLNMVCLVLLLGCPLVGTVLISACRLALGKLLQEPLQHTSSILILCI